MSGGYHRLVIEKLVGLFDQPVMQNHWRGTYVELLVAEVLGARWRVTGGDWNAWDLEHADGTRLEVKQAAARQTWSEGQPSRPSFSIRASTGHYEGAKWTPDISRKAGIYVFGWHPVPGEEADHRDARQWCFYVVPESDLPAQKTIGLAKLNQLTQACHVASLFERVEALRLGLATEAAAERAFGTYRGVE